RGIASPEVDGPVDDLLDSAARADWSVGHLQAERAVDLRDPGRDERCDERAPCAYERPARALRARGRRQDERGAERAEDGQCPASQGFSSPVVHDTTSVPALLSRMGRALVTAW